MSPDKYLLLLLLFKHREIIKRVRGHRSSKQQSPGFGPVSAWLQLTHYAWLFSTELSQRSFREGDPTFSNQVLTSLLQYNASDKWHITKFPRLTHGPPAVEVHHFFSQWCWVNSYYTCHIERKHFSSSWNEPPITRLLRLFTQCQIDYTMSLIFCSHLLNKIFSYRSRNLEWLTGFSKTQ